MKGKIIILCLSVSALLFMSCGDQSRPITANDYVAFLEKHISILQNEKLIGWTAYATRADDEIYWLGYNYYDPWLKKEDSIRYLHGFDFATKEQTPDSDDTIALCHEWNIDVAEYPSYIDSICESFYTLVYGYRIDHVQFYGDGLCFFSSRNGWNLFYRNNSITQSVEKQ